MATNIEHIFRSFVLTKFHEIQEQPFGGGKIGSQHNGEINSPDRVNPSDDTIPSIGNLQNDPLVQKIEQVLSEVLGAESQYKPDGGETIVRTKSAKRGLSEEVQDEIPRKKSKKDKKHKDKKKKKKRKKEKKDKKYKKQSKESKLNDQENECGDSQHDIHSEPENSVSVLSTEDDVDMQFISARTQEKTAHEDINAAISSLHDTDSDRNRSDMYEEHTVSVSIQEPTKAEVVNERELENGPYQVTNVTASLFTEEESLNISDTVGGDLCLIRSKTSSMEQTEVSSLLEATEEANVPENRTSFLETEQGYPKTSLDSGLVEVKRLDLPAESLNLESMKQSVSASSEIDLQPSMEATAEAKDSVTTLGFLAMVVGKDFEATSEFLNTAKIKASERTLTHVIDMENDALPDSERRVTTQDLQKTLQLNSRTELIDLPLQQSQHGVFEKAFETISVMKPKLQEQLKKTAESDVQKGVDVASDAKTVPEMKKLAETQGSEVIMELKDSEKYPRHLQTIMDGKDVSRKRELQVTNIKDLVSSAPNIAVEAKISDATSEYGETEMSYLKTKSEHVVVAENQNTVPGPLAILKMRTIDLAPECEESVKTSHLEASTGAVIEEKIVMDVSKSISQFEDVPEVTDLGSIPETADIVKPHNLEFSKYINLRDVENEAALNLIALKKGSESSVTVKHLECTSESQHVKDSLQSAIVAQRTGFEASLELEGEKREKDVDATSESLHMIFANYSEPSLEHYTEPRVELKNSKGVPELLVMMGADIRKEQHIRGSKELTSLESEINSDLSNLQKNVECFHRNEKDVEATLESKVAPSGIYSDTVESMSKERIMGPVPHFVSGIEQNETHECTEKTQHEREAADLHILSSCQKGSKGQTEHELLLLTSESLQETNTLKSRMLPESKTIAAIHESKETVCFATRTDVSSPGKQLEFTFSKSSDLKHIPSTIKQAESVAESHADQNTESLQQKNTDIKKTNLRASPDILFSEELSKQKEKQKVEKMIEIAGVTSAPDSLYDSANDPIIVSESTMINKAIESEYHPDSVDLGRISSENITKPLYSVQLKDSEAISKSKLIDAKALETDSGATFQAGAKGDLQVPSEMETISETHKKNEMLLGLQTISVLQESDEAFRSKVPTLTNLEVHSDVLCEFNTENLQLPPQCEEVEIVKKSEGAQPSPFTTDIVGRKVSSSFVSSTENEHLNASKAAETVVTVEKSKASTEYADVLEKAFEHTCMTNLKGLEASQNLETHPESLGRKEMDYIYTGSSAGMKGSETLKSGGSHISESVLKVTDKVEEHSGMDLEPDAQLVVKYSESVPESVTVSEKEDMSMTVFVVDVTDLEASSSCLDTRQTSNLETTIWIETTSTPICALEPMDSDHVVESLPKIETKDLGQVVNSEKVLEVTDAIITPMPLKTLDLDPSASISAAEVTGSVGILDLKATPTCLNAACSATVVETKAVEVIDLETHLKPVNTSEVFESTFETDCDVERQQHIAAPCENMAAAEPVSKVICSSNVEELKSTSEPKRMEPAHSSDKKSQLQLHFERKCSEIMMEHAHISDLRNVVHIDTASFAGEKSPKPASGASSVDVKNSKASSKVIVELNDKEPFLKTGNTPQFVYSVESKHLEAANKCKSLQDVGDLQVASASTEQAEKMVLSLESQTSEQNSTSGLSLEENMSIAKVKDVESTAEQIVLVEAKNSETISQFSVKVVDSETTLDNLNTAKEKDFGGIPHVSLNEQDLKTAVKPLCKTAENLEANQQVPPVLKDSETAVECVHINLEATVESMQKEKDKDLETTVEDSLKDQDSEDASKSLDITKEEEESSLKEKKSEKISSKSKDKSKSGKKAKKSRSKSLSKSKKHKKKSRSRSISRQVSTRRARSRSKNDSESRKKHSTSRHKSRSKSADRKEGKESSVRSTRRRSRSPDLPKSRSKSVDRRDISVRSRRRRSRSSDRQKSRSRSVGRKDSIRRRRLSQSSDNHRSRSRSIERRETLVRSRRRRSRSSDHRKSRSRSVDRRDTSGRRRRRRSQSSDHCKSRSRSLDRRESPIRTRRRRSRSSDNHKSRSRSADDKRESTVRTRRRRSRSPEIRKSRSRSIDRRESALRTRRRRRSRSSDNRRSKSKSVDKRETLVRTRRRRSRSSDNRRSKSKSVDKRETLVRTRRRRSRSSDNRRSKSKSVDKRETSVRTRRRRSRSSDNHRSRSKSADRRESSVRPKRRRSVSSDRKSRSKSVDKRETSDRAKRRRSRSSDKRKSRSKSVDNTESSRSKRRRSKSPDHKSGTKSVENGEPPLKSRHRRSKSSDRQVSRSKSRSKSSERKKDKDSSEGSQEKHSRHRSKSKSPENTEKVESLEATVHSKSPEQHKSKSRSRSKSIGKTDEKESSRRSKSRGSKSPETRSQRRRTVSRSRTRKRASRSKSDQRSRTRSLTRSRSRSRRWKRTRSRSVSRQRSLSRERRRRSRRNRSRSLDRRRRRSDSRESYRISLRLRSRSRTPARLRCSRSIGRRRSPSKSPDHRRSRSSSRSPKRLTDLDKAQLLEIAKANAAAMCAKAGVPLPPSLMPVVTPEKKEEKVTQKTAKETILELTEKCKKIAQSQEDDVIVNKPHVSDEEEEEHPFINHPFKLNEPKPIFFNLSTPTIKPVAPKNQVSLTKEFPVSSGSQHRKKEADSAYGEWVPVEKNKDDEKKDDVFPNPANLEPVDISSALTERTLAQKRLTENTFDLEAMCLLNRAQERIDAWAELNSIPGHFTGSTGVQVLSSEQLSNSGPQAWVKKDQFLRAAPVRGGMGAQLMRKMGWREGEGLGKNKEGNKEPILVDFKTDRKGLVAIGEKTQKRHGIFGAVKDLSGKHPVSALLEVCNKRRWSPPVFVLVNDNRPEYRNNFVFKVMVNGVEYKPSFVSPNKKHAKATAATVALQALGLVPKDLLANATNFRSASHN